MDLVNKIRSMSEFVETDAISKSLSIPIELVEGILNGSVDESVLKEFDPSSKVTVVEKQVITRGQILTVLQNAPLAAEMALYISRSQSVAIIDLERYSNLPLYLGIDIQDIPQSVNILWDDCHESKKYKNNLCVYTLPENSSITLIYDVFKTSPTTIINISTDQWEKISPVSNVIYLPLPQNKAGIHRAYQFLTQNKQYEEKIQIVWINNDSSADSKYLSIVRNFSNARIAGWINDMSISLFPGKYQKQIAKILEPLYPETRRNKVLGIF